MVRNNPVAKDIKMKANAPIEPQILYEDEHLLAVDKPSGLAVHRGWARDRFVLVDWVRQATGQGIVYPVGRLDKGTSGVVLFARDKDGARQMQEVMSRADTTKHYVALVRGKPPEEGVIDHPIPREPKGERVDSLTRFNTLATATTEPRHLSLVEAFPVTGRLHQIRRHLKHINHPIIGDSKYGRTELNRDFRARYGLARMALHAWNLKLEHPISGRSLSLRSPIPSSLSEPLLKMGFSPTIWTGAE
jgi:tRNA pseudouridine65 synthase